MLSFLFDLPVDLLRDVQDRVDRIMNHPVLARPG